MRIIVFLSQKGGVGKTTSCLNLAALLAEAGRRVLIVDLDSNACASQMFGVVGSQENSVAAALLGEQPLSAIIHPTDIERLWLAPGTTNLSLLERQIVADPTRANEQGQLDDIALALEIGRLPPDAFDFVLVDCPGGHLFTERMALLAGTEVVIPTGLSIIDLYAATPTLQLILMAQDILGGNTPAFLGFLPNGAGKGGIPRKIRGELEIYAMPCFTPIRQSAVLRSIASAPEVRQRIMVLAYPDHPVTASFRQVAREIELGIDTARAERIHAEADSLQAPIPTV